VKPSCLEGLRILVVEDEFLIATLIEDMLETSGCAVAGPVSRLPAAVEAASREECAAAILDVNLAGQRIDPVAEILSQRDIPFLFVTGYAADALPRQHAERPCLHKPFKNVELLAALCRLVSGRGAR
jgi:CheY-like chemotaxis protein